MRYTSVKKAGFATVGDAEDSLPPDSEWLHRTEESVREFREKLKTCRDHIARLTV